MSGFFSSDNKIFGVMSKVFDLMVLGIMWLVLCIPIITIGPTCTAMYYTVVKVVRKERSYLLKEFFHSFKLNFRQGAVISLIYAAFAGIMYVDFQWVSQVSEDVKYSNTLIGVFLALCIFAVLSALYAFPLLSRFTVKTGQLFKWAFLLSVRHILTTIIMLLTLVAAVVLSYYCIVTTIATPLLLVMPALYTLIISFPMEKVMKKYMPKVEETDEESGVDHWYNE